jgi:hypothetical protein
VLARVERARHPRPSLATPGVHGKGHRARLQVWYARVAHRGARL